MHAARGLRTRVTWSWLAFVAMFAACKSEQAPNTAGPWPIVLDEPTDLDGPNTVDGPEEVPTPNRVTQLTGGGISVKAGANATLWRPGEGIKPPYRLSMRVRTTNRGLHAHGAGIVFGGSDIDNERQAYTYFLVRGDGHFLIKARNGGDTDPICFWTKHEAVQKEDDSEYVATNDLAVKVEADQVEFFVNGASVHTAKCATAGPGLRTKGRYGVRLVHDLDVRFDQIQFEQQ